MRLGTLAPTKTETSDETTYLQTSEKTALNENNVLVSMQINVSQEDTSTAEVHDGSQPLVVIDKYLVQSEESFASIEVSQTEDKVSMEVERPVVKLKSHKFLTKIKGNNELSWVGIILVALAVIILLPLVLIGLMVLYLYFFPMW